MTYDSRPDTLEHIENVRGYLAEVVAQLEDRARDHDASKLEQPELAVFDEFTPKLEPTTYPSAEYDQHLKDMDPGLQLHYAANDHHPEHGDGTLGWMTLVQVIEMLCDWKAATLRHADGDLGRSIESNAERYQYGPEIRRLLWNTADAFGWL